MVAHLLFGITEAVEQLLSITIEWILGQSLDNFMRNYLLPISLISLLLLSGCSSTSTASASRIAVLQNPETKQTVQCKVDPWGSLNFAIQVDNCIKVYEKAGYKKVADSADM